MVFHGAYHGGVLLFQNGGSPVNAPYPFVLGRYNDAEGASALIAEHASRLAAVLVEPVTGTGGALPAEPEFLQALRVATARHGVLLIFDEVMTSRLSPGGAQALYGIAPDLTSFGKYLGGGLTFGAFGGRAEILDRFDPRRPDALPHAGTFNNNVLTMAAGAAGLREVYTPEVAIAHNARGDALREALNETARRRGAPVHATGRGSMLGIHFARETVTRPEQAACEPADVKALFHLDMIRRGHIIGRIGLCSTSLPLEEADYHAFVEAFDGFLEESGPLLEASVG
jgi:glutamate-1-semialdehyde 2,1-aminomutase